MVGHADYVGIECARRNGRRRFSSLIGTQNGHALQPSLPPHSLAFGSSIQRKVMHSRATRPVGGFAGSARAGGRAAAGIAKSILEVARV